MFYKAQSVRFLINKNNIYIDATHIFLKTLNYMELTKTPPPAITHKLLETWRFCISCYKSECLYVCSHFLYNFLVSRFLTVFRYSR